MENVNAQYAQAKRTVQKRKGFYIHAIVYFCVNAFIIISNGIASDKGFADADAYFTAFFWGFGLLGHASSVFAPGFIFGKEWEERKIKKIMNS